MIQAATMMQNQATGGGSPSYDSLILAASPIGYWPSEESSGVALLDATGHGYDGIYSPSSGSPQAWTGGSLGNPGIPGDVASTVASYDGATGIATTGLTPAPGDGDFSVEAWVKTSASGLQVILSAYAGGDYFYLATFGTTVVFNVNGAGTAGISTAIGDGDYHHLVGLRRSGVCYVYVDGSPSGGSSYAGSCLPASPLVVSSLAGTTFYYFDGAIAKSAYYNYGLTDAIVAAHYAAGI